MPGRNGWTHAICVACWNKRNPEREPMKLREPPLEPCCFCGAVSAGGIYVREAPASVPLCQGHEDATR